MKNLFFTLTLACAVLADTSKTLRVVEKSPAQSSRSLFLGLGKSKEVKKREQNMKNLVQLLELADGFQEDPNFAVGVKIHYQNPDMTPGSDKHAERRLTGLEDPPRRLKERVVVPRDREEKSRKLYKNI